MESKVAAVSLKDRLKSGCDNQEGETPCYNCDLMEEAATALDFKDKHIANLSTEIGRLHSKLGSDCRIVSDTGDIDCMYCLRYRLSKMDREDL